MVSVFLGLVYANFFEWFAHKYIFHKCGKKKNSIVGFHWRDHHKTSRKNAFEDKKTSTSEIVWLLFALLLHLPTYFLSPLFFATLIFCSMWYYLVHQYAHNHPQWAKKYLRWHYDHHMGKDQDKNWNVTYPLCDYLLGTREKYDY